MPKKPVEGKYDARRYSWLNTGQGEIALYLGDSRIDRGESSPEHEPGEPIRLTFKPRTYTRAVAISLTSFTEEELDLFMQFVADSVELARPVVANRDQHAKRKLEEEGDDSFTRNYRAVPQLFVRERVLQEYDSGLPSGPDDDDEGDGSGAAD